MPEIDLCLLDCSSIQRYVFGSNKLKSNIGASHIVVKVYDEWLESVVTEVTAGECKINEWCKHPEAILMLSDPNLLIEMETGYIGGGNALLMFRRTNGASKAQDFVRKWTRKLLLEAPGVQPVIAIHSANLPPTAADMDAVFKILEKNKNLQKAETIIPRHGITAECKVTGLSADGYSPILQEYVSAVAATKIAAVDDATEIARQKYLDDKVFKGFTFSNEVDELGQTKGEDNHIAIVHIDGNNIGERFKACESLADKRLLAKRIDKITQEAMRETMRQFKPKFLDLVDDKLDPYWNPETQECYMPLRPIILNGDDVTFVCDARLGFYFAETFMREFSKMELDDIPALQNTDLKKLSSCAGIAITRTKYPFYRGYQLAEELCKEAKKYGRPTNTSWLDFHFSHSGLSYHDLDELRARQYMVGENCLLWRPWQVDDPDDKKSFLAAKEAIKHFRTAGREGKGWPNSKLNDFFHSLVQGQERTKEFLAIAQSRGLTLPEIPGVKHAASNGWVGNFTPYYDIIEMMDFYPPALMEENNV